MSSYGYGPGTTAGGFRSDAVDAFNGKKQYEKVTTSIVPDRGYDLHDAKFVKSQKAKLQHYEKQNLAHADVLTMTAEGEKLARSFKEKELEQPAAGAHTRDDHPPLVVARRHGCEQQTGLFKDPNPLHAPRLADSVTVASKASLPIKAEGRQYVRADLTWDYV
eukprot:CAMPEP_0113886024 /NCGR_PEP_ID=MMETSP0780_2-20120614/11287_1 /TAXON_ID=652834 /ORGANISM="Palpitomonas bilix" /LENGTH=162 /DNA_ID=CAMNT_0000874117 /DNA_START=148 /DNA_END=635 /DNA_ORIENTATION=- /assembly_acc=CAM_ASM_000599